MQRRFAFIESRLLWGGGVCATEVGETFGIARPNAQKTIEKYRERHPGQMRYDKHLRRHVREPGFEPCYVRDNVSRFLDYQRAVSQIAHFYDEPGWSDLPFTDAEALSAPIYDTEAIRVVLEALRRERVVEIEYFSKSGTRIRRISPHQLGFADARFHLRAYCHERLVFRDFVLPRVVSAAIVGDDWVPGDADRDWRERTDLAFGINPEIPKATQAALRLDFLGPGQSQLRIRGVRMAIAYYVECRMERIDARFEMPLWISVPR